MSAERVVDHGEWLTIDVVGLSAELRDTIDRQQRVMMQMTRAEWDEWCALDMQGRSDWLDARSGAA